MSIPQVQMNPQQIKAIFAGHPGAQKRVAETLGVRAGAVSHWLAGRFGSKRIEAECTRLAVELLASEQGAEKTAA